MSRRPVSPRARTAASASSATATAPRPSSRSARPGAGRPGSTRPAARPGAGSGPSGAPKADDAEPVPVTLARLISVRALVLAIVVLVAFSMLFPTIRAYLGQQAELQALSGDVAAAERAEKDSQAELDRWSDPAYVEAQARERLSFVNPGETSYRVIDPEVVVEAPAVEGTTAGPAAGPALPTGGAEVPWYATVWQSVEIAGDAPISGTKP